MPIFKVITVTTVKNVYYVEAEKPEHAADSIVMEEVEWDDTQQKHLDESIISIEENTDKLRTLVGVHGPVLVREEEVEDERA